MVALLVLAVPAGVLGISQTAQAQLGEDIANSVLDSVFGTNADDGTEEEEDATETEEEEGITGDDNQDIDQTQDQSNEQDAEVNQPITQESSQDETNIVDNDLETGDNSATVAQSNEEDQQVSADADADDNVQNAASEADAEDDDHIKAKKSYVSDSDTTSAESQADAIISATAEATGIQGDQNNTADVDQDSSVHDVDLSNNVAFAEDTNTQIAVPISDIDQRAANLAEQRAANLDVEENEVLPYGFTVNPTTGEVVDCFPPSGATPPPFCD